MFPGLGPQLPQLNPSCVKQVEWKNLDLVDALVQHNRLGEYCWSASCILSVEGEVEVHCVDIRVARTAVIAVASRAVHNACARTTTVGV